MTGAEKLREEGRAAGAARLLLSQLALRFGKVPPEVQERVASASLEQLDAWARRILTADKLADVVGE